MSEEEIETRLIRIIERCSDALGLSPELSKTPELGELFTRAENLSQKVSCAYLWKIRAIVGDCYERATEANRR